MYSFRFILPFLLILPLTGCFEAAMLGAAGGAGYLANNEIDKSMEKKRQAVAREEQRKYENALQQQKQLYQSKLPSRDEFISNQITHSYMNGELTQVMSVTPVVQNGTVTLMGVVPSPIIADRAVEAARRIPGVTMVVSRLMIDERRIEPITDSSGRQVRPPYPHMQQSAQQTQPYYAPQAYAPQPAMAPVYGGAVAAPVAMVRQVPVQPAVLPANDQRLYGILTGAPVPPQAQVQRRAAQPVVAVQRPYGARATPVSLTAPAAVAPGIPPQIPVQAIPVQPASQAVPVQPYPQPYAAPVALPVAAGADAELPLPVAPSPAASSNNMRPLVPGGPEPTLLPPAPPPPPQYVPQQLPAQIPVSPAMPGMVQQPARVPMQAVPAYPVQAYPVPVPAQVPVQAYGPPPVQPINMQGLEDSTPKMSGEDDAETILLKGTRPPMQAGSREHWYPKRVF